MLVTKMENGMISKFWALELLRLYIAVTPNLRRFFHEPLSISLKKSTFLNMGVVFLEEV